MKYPKYREYKDSNHKWIKDIPGNWEIKKLKLCLSRIESGNREIGGGNQLENGVFSIGGEHIDWEGNINLNNPKYISEFFYSNLNSGKVMESDVLLVKDGATIGKVAYVQELSNRQIAINEHVFLLRANNLLYPKFLYYFLYSKIGQTQIELNVRGAAQGGLNSSFIQRLYITIPPIDVQKSISLFLDNEVDRLSKLINKQIHMIELIKEKRQAIITNVVTKGLDPSVPMKDSGIEWIGKIPEPWTTMKIKHTSYVKGRVGWKGLTSEEYQEDGYAYLVTGQDFQSKRIRWDSCYCVDKFRYEDDPYIQLKNGDLLITKDGTIGKLALVNGLEKPACLNSGIFLVRPYDYYITDFLYYVLSSSVFSGFYLLRSFGSTIQHLYQNIFVDFSFPIPPRDEQGQMVSYLEKQTSKIDKIISMEERMIQLLKEYKISLITQAVTGKIDVRGFAASTTSNYT